MGLVAGTRLGPYEIQSAIGAGGMGEVYKARDTRLDRTVAIKILRPEVSADPDRRARFEREAKTIAGLSHPHICTLYDVGEHPSTSSGQATLYLVMELLQGETLADRLLKGPLPIAEALTAAAQIAEALDYAHERGIVHRDLKPANIKLTADGAVKVLDFGLAKAFDPSSGSGSPASFADPANSPTITGPAPVTRAGVILGTAAYMAPEQALGPAADKRADIWAFGVVFFEMLARRACFAGDTVTDVLAAVVRTEPDWALLPGETPHRVRDLLRRCLEKDRKQRLRDIGDARFEIEAARTSAPTNGAAEIPGPSPARTAASGYWPRRRVLAAVAAVAAVLGGLAAWGWLRPQPAPQSRQVLHLPLSISHPPRALDFWGAALALSRDGSRIAYRTSQGWQLLDLATGVSRVLSTELAGDHAVFSPSGDRLLIRQGHWVGQLVSLSLSTGASRLLFSPLIGGEMEWANDGWIYFGRQYGVSRVREQGTKVEDLVVGHIARDGWSAHNPVPLPGGTAVIFTRRQRPFSDHSRDEICAVDLATRGVTVLAKGQQAWYVSAGYLLWIQPGGALFAAPFDASRLQFVGPAVQVLDGIATLETMYGAAVLKIADEGTLLYATRAPLADDELVWVDRGGRRRETVTWPGGWVQNGGLSSDGARVVASVAPGLGPFSIWLWNVSAGPPVRISQAEFLDVSPQLLPGDQRISYVGPRLGKNWDLYVTSADARGEERVLLDRPGDISDPSFTIDGWVAFCETGPNGQSDVFAHRMGTETTIAIAATPARETMPAASPDARWVAYQSDVSGREEVYVRPLQTAGREQQVSTGGGREPWWHPGGRELFYVNGKGELVGVPVDGTGSAAGQAERVLFALGDLTWARMVLPGTRGFVMVRHRTTEAPGELVLVKNWFEELKAKVPTTR
jgi:eukaryotic-like serine/threonine-protein kinase